MPLNKERCISTIVARQFLNIPRKASLELKKASLEMGKEEKITKKHI